MNFSSHQKKLIISVEDALSKTKRDLCSGFIATLQEAASLYKTEDYEFWIEQIRETKLEEIPVTTYGHQKACASVEKIKNESRCRVQDGIYSIAKDLFSYSSVDDCCPAQSDYYYYYDQNSEKIYKESELGFSEGVEHGADVCCRIARVSELQISADELYQ